MGTGFGARFGGGGAGGCAVVVAEWVTTGGAGSDESDAVGTEGAAGAIEGLGCAAGVAVIARGRGTLSGTSPSHCGFRQMITAMPHAVTRTSIAMKATSFCAVDGPRGRMTTVIARGRRGLSAMRIVIWFAPRPAGVNGSGVNGSDDGPRCAAAGIEPDEGTPAIASGMVCGTALPIGVVMLTGGAEGTVSSTLTMTAGAVASLVTYAAGTLCGRAEA